MKTKHQYLLFFFWIALLADCYLIYSQQDNMRLFTKGAVMLLLLLYFVVNTYRGHHLPSRVLGTIAFVLAWVGDILLLYKGEDNFITGLGLFLVMHIIYIVYFWRMHPPFPVRHPANIYLPLLLVAGYDFLLMNKLLPLTGALKIPLLAYMVVISVMFVLACNIQGSKKSGTLAMRYFVPAAVLFILSDSLLGLNMFLWEDYILGIPIMLSYGYAQQLMVHGFIKHIKGRV